MDRTTAGLVFFIWVCGAAIGWMAFNVVTFEDPSPRPRTLALIILACLCWPLVLVVAPPAMLYGAVALGCSLVCNRWVTPDQLWRERHQPVPPDPTDPLLAEAMREVDILLKTGGA